MKGAGRRDETRDRERRENRIPLEVCGGLRWRGWETED